MPRAIATYSQKRAMEGLILENTMVLDRPDNRAWFAGWNFARVAKAVNKDFNADHAARVARDIGLTVLPTPPPPSVEARVEALEQQVQQLASMVGDIITDLVNMDREFRDAHNAKEWHANPDYADASNRGGHGDQMGLGSSGESPLEAFQFDSGKGVPEVVYSRNVSGSSTGDSDDVEAGGRIGVSEDKKEAGQGHA